MPETPTPTPTPTPSEFPRFYLIEVVHCGAKHVVACEAILSVKIDDLPSGVRTAIYDAFTEQTGYYPPDPLPAPPPPIPLPPFGSPSDCDSSKKWLLFAMSKQGVSQDPPT